MKLKKYKKYHTNKNIYKTEKIRSCLIKQGLYGLKAMNKGILTPKQVETTRRIISRITNRYAKILIQLNFEQSLTKKPLLSRMGRGSGGIYEWVSYIKKGKIIFEFFGVCNKTAKLVFKVIKKCLPIKFELVFREINDA